MTPPDYPYVRAWARFQGYPSERAAAMVALARTDHAPDDAVYKKGLRWVVLGELTAGPMCHLEKLATWIRKGH